MDFMDEKNRSCSIEEVEISMENSDGKNEKLTKPRRNRRSNNYKSLPQNQCPSICRICKNPAIGYHYEVPSCNGCKTFFRRCIINGRKFKCSKVSNCLDGQDVIDSSKRVCRACRFEKCVQAGMNPMAIQAEIKTEEGEKLRLKIAGNFEKSEKIHVFFNVEEKINEIIQKLTKMESKFEGIHNNGMPLGFKDTRDLATVISSRVIFDSTKIPSMSYSPVKISKHTGLPKRRSRNFVHSSCLTSIEYSKTFDFSSAIDLNSKILLLKHTSLILANLMNAFTTFRNLKSDVLLYPDGSIYGPPRRKTGPLIEKQRSFLQKTLISFMENRFDKTEYLLLKAIIICNPAISGIPPCDSKHLQREREVYANCLFRYCLLQHGTLNGPARFSSLLSIFSILENQQKAQKDYYSYIKAIHSLKHSDPEVLEKKCVSILYDQIMDD